MAALKSAADGHDVVITSGGVSVGEEDHVKAALQRLGELDLWQINIKPGKPFALGRLGAADFIGLPGNPVSAFVTFLLLARRFLLARIGLRASQPTRLNLAAAFDWPKPDKRRNFLRARLNGDGQVELFPQQGSGVLTSMVWAEGLVDIAPGQTVATGDTVSYLPLATLL
jgi:molybdopterin molybdotransferase